MSCYTVHDVAWHIHRSPWLTQLNYPAELSLRQQDNKFRFTLHRSINGVLYTVGTWHWSIKFFCRFTIADVYLEYARLWSATVALPYDYSTECMQCVNHSMSVGEWYLLEMFLFAGEFHFDYLFQHCPLRGAVSIICHNSNKRLQHPDRLCPSERSRPYKQLQPTDAHGAT